MTLVSREGQQDDTNEQMSSWVYLILRPSGASTSDQSENRKEAEGAGTKGVRDDWWETWSESRQIVEAIHLPRADYAGITEL